MFKWGFDPDAKLLTPVVISDPRVGALDRVRDNLERARLSRGGFREQVIPRKDSWDS